MNNYLFYKKLKINKKTRNIYKKGKSNKLYIKYKNNMINLKKYKKIIKSKKIIKKKGGFFDRIIGNASNAITLASSHISNNGVVNYVESQANKLQHNANKNIQNAQSMLGLPKNQKPVNTTALRRARQFGKHLSTNKENKAPDTPVQQRERERKESQGERRAELVEQAKVRKAQMLNYKRSWNS